MIATFTAGTFTISGRSTVYACVSASHAQKYLLKSTGYDEVEDITLSVTKDQFTDALPAPWIDSARVIISHNGETYAVVSFNSDELHYILKLKPAY